MIHVPKLYKTQLYTNVYKNFPYTTFATKFHIIKKNDIIQLVQHELELQAQENSQTGNQRF